MKLLPGLVLYPLLLAAGCSKEDAPGTGPGTVAALPAPLPGEKATITGNRVNIRAKAEAEAPVVLQLDKGDTVSWIEAASGFRFSGKYHGRWIKIALGDGREGYVFSTFVKRGGDDAEEFHVFFENLERNWRARNEPAVLGALELPLAAEASFEGETEKKRLSAEEVFDTLLLGGPYTDPVRFATAEDGVRCTYGYEGSNWTLSFRQRNGKWRLFRVAWSSC